VESGLTRSQNFRVTVRFRTLEGQDITTAGFAYIPVSLTNLAKLETGRTVPVRYDPKNPAAIAGMEESDWADAEAAFGRGIFDRADPYAAHLPVWEARSEGWQGTAVVDAFADGGSDVLFHVTVWPQTGTASFPSMLAVNFSEGAPLRERWCTVGAQIPVRFDAPGAARVRLDAARV